MKQDLFTELIESDGEGAAILRGDKEPSRRFEIAIPSDSTVPKDGCPS